jgi:hypothetical protein
MPTIREYQAMRPQNPEPKAAGVMTEFNPLTGKHRVRVFFKNNFHLLEEEFATLEQAHAAGNLKLHALGYIPGHPDSYR